MDDLAFFGVSDKDAEEAMKDVSDEPEVFEILEENWPTVEFFMAVRGQWRTASSMAGGIRYALDYSAFREARLGLGIRMSQWPGIFRGVQIMESAALEVFNEQTK